jgi:trans-L-3-hydroxyproline dehydratase
MKHKQLIDLEEELIVASIINTRFRGSIKSEIRYEDYDAVVPLVAGDAFITGQHYFYLDSADPIQEGFIIG